MNNQTTVINKNNAEEIRIGLSDFNGNQYIDIRTFWRKSEDEVIPTKKGISLGTDKLDELITALEGLRP